ALRLTPGRNVRKAVRLVIRPLRAPADDATTPSTTTDASTSAAIAFVFIRHLPRDRPARGSVRLARRGCNAQGVADDPVLLGQVRGRIPLARARAPGAADVAEVDATGSALGERVLEPVAD